MDGSAFWVGPGEEPDRYQLTHLLGSGGEGEVWRAVRSGQGDREVAIKIDALAEDGSDDWQERLRSLSELDIRGLVRIEEAFTGIVRHRLDDHHGSAHTHRYVVMDHVNGLTLRTWLDEHPDASAQQRIRILRGVAATLSRLHRGDGARASITHGDVKPANIIVGDDGKPTLVDLGLLRPVGSGPTSGHTAAYSSPELRNPDSRPSPRADTFSFAVTAMETLTALTPPLTADGSLDLASTRDRIRSASSLRFRPVLKEQLLRSLASEPNGRPPTPTRVFAGRTLAAVALPLVMVLGAGGSAFALTAGRGSETLQTTGTENEIPTATVAGPTTTLRPTKKPSEGGRASANPTASHSPTATAEPIRSSDPGKILTGLLERDMRGGDVDGCGPRAWPVVANPDGDLRTWGSETFTLTLTSNHRVEVLGAYPESERAAEPQSLSQAISVSCPNGGSVSVPTDCDERKPPYRLDTTYHADLDAKTLREQRTGDKRPFGVMPETCLPPSVLTLDAAVCLGNYDYYLRLDYKRADDPLHIYSQRFGPIHARAKVTRKPFVTSLDALASYSTSFSGGPSGCRAEGVTHTVPYTSVTDEAERLLVAAVRKRHVGRGLTLAEAAKQISSESAWDTEPARVVYTADDLIQLCQEAASHSWRTTCGPPDPTVPATPSEPASPTP